MLKRWLVCSPRTLSLMLIQQKALLKDSQSPSHSQWRMAGNPPHLNPMQYNTLQIKEILYLSSGVRSGIFWCDDNESQMRNVVFEEKINKYQTFGTSEYNFWPHFSHVFGYQNYQQAHQHQCQMRNKTRRMPSGSSNVLPSTWTGRQRRKHIILGFCRFFFAPPSPCCDTNSSISIYPMTSSTVEASAACLFPLKISCFNVNIFSVCLFSCLVATTFFCLSSEWMEDHLGSIWLR